ncbi:nucleotidyltransferase domain-containing protein [Patescibacteria group bacterium]|nr:nucleotidyltransferase domain-containing protein [Patescibacteria group bacterium]
MDISNLFKSKVRKALFKLYFTNPESEFYLRELERMLSIPVSMIRKELVRLEREGVFSFHKRGNLAYYHINKDYPLFSELKSIVFKTIGVQGLLNEALRKIKGVEFAFIYGSYAKGNEKANSDIDLCVIGTVDEDILVRRINGLEKSFKREINYTLYTKKEFIEKRREKDSFILDLISNPKIMLIGGEHGL